MSKRRGTATRFPGVAVDEIVSYSSIRTGEDDDDDNNNSNNEIDNNNNNSDRGEIQDVLALLPPVPKIIYGLFIVGPLLIYLLMGCFVIPPGMVGVVVTLGKLTSYDSGLHIRSPFISRLEILSTKTQSFHQSNKVPTKEGLSIQLDSVIIFKLDGTKASELYSEVGMDYIQVIIEPQAASAIRGLTSMYEAKALYSSGRDMIQNLLKTELSSKLEPNGIIIEDVLLKDLLLPDTISKSIELKMKAEQDAERMEYVLQKEEQEAARKSIEAGGIASFQEIVSDGISPELLKWKAIEATEKFATAVNTKIVMVGSNDGNNSPPIILKSD